MTNSTSRPDPITAGLRELRDRLAGVDSGEIATYIPELSHADPEWFGIALCTLGGLYQAGDSQRPFTIQSVSKPFVYALALADQGIDKVLAHVGVEPSGEAFNAIRLDPDGRPFNPMINAGAIVTSWLVHGSGPDEKFERIRSGLSAFAGRELPVDEQVLASEMATSDGNRALCYLMRGAGTLDCDVEDVLSVYFRQCLVCELQSDMGFTGAETIVRGVAARLGPDELTDVRWLVLDLSRVGELESVAVTLLSVFARQLAECGIQTVVTDPRLRALFGDQVPEYASLAGAPLPLCRI